MGKVRNQINGKLDHAAKGQRYAQEVTLGQLPACRWIRLACERQLRDLAAAAGDDFPYRFDRDAANRVCEFVELLPHVKGRWASRTIQLQDWQCFALTVLFGWLRKDTGYRRFRRALIVVPRKNSKTTMAAGIGLFMLSADGEPGADVLCGAVTRQQVTDPNGLWTTAQKMVQRSREMCDELGIQALAHAITVEQSNSSFKAVSRDAGPIEGGNPHLWILDEVHAFKTREVFDVFNEATGSRRQSLGLIISTEGDSTTGVLAEQVDYLQQVLKGGIEDDSYFGLYYSIDQDIDWTTPLAWGMANPNLGVSVLEDDLAIRCRQAQRNAESQSSFLTKRLNVRVGAGSAYFNMLAWEHKCKDETLLLEDFYGHSCWIFLDLASKQDLCAKLQVFQRDGRSYVFGKYYLPEDTAEDHGNPNHASYAAWSNDELLTLTPGNITDYEFIERDLQFDVRNFGVVKVCYDPFQATQFATRMLAGGIPMVEYGMTVRNFSEPMKQLAADIVAGKIQHDGDPVLTWAVGNVTAKVDAKENVYPRKQRPENKIDPAVALIGACAQMARFADIRSAYAGATEVVI